MGDVTLHSPHLGRQPRPSTTVEVKDSAAVFDLRWLSRRRSVQSNSAACAGRGRCSGAPSPSTASASPPAEGAEGEGLAGNADGGRTFRRGGASGCRAVDSSDGLLLSAVCALHVPALLSLRRRGMEADVAQPRPSCPSLAVGLSSGAVSVLSLVPSSSQPSLLLLLRAALVWRCGAAAFSAVSALGPCTPALTTAACASADLRARTALPGLRRTLRG